MQKNNGQGSKLASLKTSIQMLECLLLRQSTYFIFLNFLGDCIRWHISCFHRIHLWYYAITNNKTWQQRKWACLPHYRFSFFYGQTRMISHPGLSWTVSVLALQVLSSRIPLTSGQTRRVGHPSYTQSIIQGALLISWVAYSVDPWNEIYFKGLVGLISRGYS